MKGKDRRIIQKNDNIFIKVPRKMCENWWKVLRKMCKVGKKSLEKCEKIIEQN